MSSEPPPARSWLRRNRLADLQRAATANERMVLDDLDRIGQAARADQRVAAQPPRCGTVGDAIAGDYLRWPQRGARIDHVAAHACRPPLERGHHLLPRLGRSGRTAAAVVGDQERWHRYLR